MLYFTHGLGGTFHGIRVAMASGSELERVFLLDKRERDKDTERKPSPREGFQ